MTEEVDNYLDLEQFPNKMDKAEEDADKFNDLTFNSELPWEYDEVGIDNDSFLKTFEFDNFNDANNRELESHMENDDKASNDLLGLTGSLINFRIFKSHNNQEMNENNILKDAEFETAFNKLNLVDQSDGRVIEESFPPLPTLSNDEATETTLTFSSSPVVDSPFIQLTKFSELLYNQFQQYQKSDTNLHMLNQLVSNHLNMLSKQLQILNLSMDILPQLRYFRILMNFVAIDNKLTEIQTKFAHNPVQLNLEIAQIIQHFTLQAPKQQLELCVTHPFYSNLMSMVASQNQQARSVGPGNPPLLPPSSLPEWASDEDRHQNEAHRVRCRQFLESEGGWLSESERDWLIKVQTRSLTTDNPYVHDYYFTRLKLNQLTEERRLEILACGHTSIADPLSQLPSPITAEQLGVTVDPSVSGSSQSSRAAGPIHFEKSLGVLSPSNLNAPRQIIQLRRQDNSGRKSSSSAPSSPSSSATSSYRAVRAQRELLGLIEKMYSIVLRVDEVDKSLARMLVEQHRSRGVLIQHRNHLLRLLSDCIIGDNARFVELLSVAKGARVVMATVAIVTTAQFVQVLRTIFFNSISVCESRFFPDIEPELRSIVCSRVRNLRSEELTALIGAFYSNVTPNSLEDKLKLQPLSGFCSNEFGLTIILTVLDTFLKTNPNDKAHVTQLLSITIKSSEPQSLLLKCMKEFKYLFPTTDRH